jgi:hypothetical protein
MPPSFRSDFVIPRSRVRDLPGPSAKLLPSTFGANSWSKNATTRRSYSSADAKPGQLVRFWVVDAGPSFDTDFLIVGTVLNTAYPFGSMRQEDARTTCRRSPCLRAGGGVFDVRIEKPGLYPFVSHAYAAVDTGQVGLLNVGNVKGTMSH